LNFSKSCFSIFIKNFKNLKLEIFKLIIQFYYLQDGYFLTVNLDSFSKDTISDWIPFSPISSTNTAL